MSIKWPHNGSDIGGILKRRTPINLSQNNEKNLLIFGYGCKIFRDDDRAQYIDQGKHLIPWMDNNNHRIDRYDVRATLSDLAPYEPPAGGYQNRLDYLSPEERRAEQLCQEERYFSLKHNEEEELMYQEEELKRLHQERSTSYGQVKFDYNSTTVQENTNNDTDITTMTDEPDELYTPPSNFNIPISLPLPMTMKLHAIIEKTAKFISTQGPQMEILIKAKQSNNPQFEFLNQNHFLNPYYKFVLEALKNGTYPKEEDINNKPDNSTEQKQQTDNKNMTFNDGVITFSSYSVEPPRITIPTIQYKPSANCAYTQLISKIKGLPLPKILNSESPTIPPDTTPPNTESQTTVTKTIENGTIQNKVLDNKSAIIIPKDNSKLTTKVGGSGVEIKNISSALALAQCYSSDSDDENCDDSDNQNEPSTKSEQKEPEPDKDANITKPILNIPVPPDSDLNVIEKTASYVAKNGKQFEETLKLKGDERFEFLNESHIYHPYYLYRVTGVVPTTKPTIESKIKPLLPVSFSIKTKEEPPVTMKPVLSLEGSDEESDNSIQDQLHSVQSLMNITNTTIKSTNSIIINENPNPVPASKLPEHVQKAIKMVENQLVAKCSRSSSSSSSGQPVSSSTKSRFDVDSAGNPINQQNHLESQKELKRAEEKVKDRLAQIAREKLGLISKEKQLQIERKKKAMAFLNQIKGRPDMLTPPLTNATHKSERNEHDSDKDSVHSIPISSYGACIDNDIKSRSNKRSPSLPLPPPSLPSIIQLPGDTTLDIEFISMKTITAQEQRSRSRSKTTSSSAKKSKRHRDSSSRRKSKKRTKSRSRSRSYSYSRSHSLSPANHKSRSTSSRKLKKRKRN